jgi:hypothetical protein
LSTQDFSVADIENLRNAFYELAAKSILPDLRAIAIPGVAVNRSI